MMVGVSATFETTFSALLRESGAVLERLESGDVLLHRRDGADVMLVLADSETELRESIGAFSRMIGALADETLAEREEQIAEALPWLTFLGADDRAAFLRELVHTARACAELDNYRPLARCLHEWKNTARLIADPELRAAVHADHDTDELVPPEHSSSAAVSGSSTGSTS